MAPRGRIANGLGSETLTYDHLGRVTDRPRVIDGQSVSFHYTHNLADEPTTPTMLAGPDWYASVENEPCP
jgi:hypothetical protein